MKKVIALLGVLALIFTGCASNGENKGATPTNAEQTDAAPTATVTAMPDITEKTDYVTEKWIATEIEFTATKKVRNINETELDVVFTNRSTGTTMTMPGFWDGNKSWKVRFAPTEYGIWDYETKTTGTDVGINGIKGTLASNAYKGELDIYKHGFIKTEKDVRYFMYADGTPFFYLGDTHWTMPKEEFDSAGPNAGDIKTNSHFRYIVDRRAAQGFTVYQSEPLQGNIKVSDGNIVSSDIDAFKNLDRYFQYIAEKGLVHANAQLLFPSAVTKAFTDNLRALTRYWIARYAAYPVMWTLGQEVDDAANFSQDQELWRPYYEMCKIISEIDPYKHPTSGHQGIVESEAEVVRWIFNLLGIFNMKGNIASIHWYNRRKVTKENQKPYCMCMGLGTLIIGVSLIAAGIIQVFAGVEVGSIFIAVGVVIGLVLMLYAQFKYNRGLF